MKSSNPNTEQVPRLILLFSYFVLRGFMVISVCSTLYGIYRLSANGWNSLFYGSLIFVSIIFLVGAYLVIKFISIKNQINITIPVFFIAVSLLSAEIILQMSEAWRSPQAQAARAQNIPYDTRSTIQVLEDLRDKYENVYANIHPSHIKNIASKSFSEILPLGGIANATTIYQNENGFYPIIQTDEYGFNNPQNQHQQDSVDVLLIGDSFTAGTSVHDEETIAGQFRQAGYWTVNLGVVGNGSLIELAQLKEYGQPLKPQVLMWMYHESDLWNLKSELENPKLKRYLDQPSYRQNLINHQDEINSILVNYLNEHEQKHLYESRIKFLRHTLFFKYLRTTLGLVGSSSTQNTRVGGFPSGMTEVEEGDREGATFYRDIAEFVRSMVPQVAKVKDLTTEQEITDSFRDILLAAKSEVSNWNGQIYFVYIPKYESYNGLSYSPHHSRSLVLNHVNDLEIPLIDLHEEVLGKDPDPLSLYPFRMNGHFNAEGYQRVGQALISRLQQDGIRP